MSKLSIESLKFWCQKVLPLTYDESLSYYEVLCKIVKKLNDLIDWLGNLDEIIKEILNDYEIPMATATKLGGVKAESLESDEGYAVNILGDGFLRALVQVANGEKAGVVFADPKNADDTLEVRIGDDGKLYVREIKLEVASETTLGGVKAKAKTDDQTQEVGIDSATGFLYVKAGGGGDSLLDWVNVKKYINQGADFSNAMVSAINEAGIGGTVYIPKGTYQNTAEVKVVADNVRIIADEAYIRMNAPWRFQGNDSKVYGVTFNSSVDDSGVVIVDSSNMVISMNSFSMYNCKFNSLDQTYNANHMTVSVEGSKPIEDLRFAGCLFNKSSNVISWVASVNEIVYDNNLTFDNCTFNLMVDSQSSDTAAHFFNISGLGKVNVNRCIIECNRQEYLSAPSDHIFRFTFCGNIVIGLTSILCNSNTNMLYLITGLSNDVFTIEKCIIDGYTNENQTSKNIIFGNTQFATKVIFNGNCVYGVDGADITNYPVSILSGEASNECDITYVGNNIPCYFKTAGYDAFDGIPTGDNTQVFYGDVDVDLKRCTVGGKINDESFSSLYFTITGVVGVMMNGEFTVTADVVVNTAGSSAVISVPSRVKPRYSSISKFANLCTLYIVIDNKIYNAVNNYGTLMFNLPDDTVGKSGKLYGRWIPNAKMVN